jgi:Arc/MetJ-type ribon-helix-helix transcriptional regulator
MAKTKNTRLPETLRMVVPAGYSAVLDELAAREGIPSRSEVMRQALRDKAERTGLRLPGLKVA